METITFTIENHTIEYHVDWMGMETITINGDIVSKKLSLPTRKHKFTLEVYGKTETFYIQSKQGFSTGHLKIQLYHNEVLIDEKTLEFKFLDPKTTKTETDNTTFILGLFFIVLTLCFDWSRIFLFVGLVFLFDALSKTHKRQKMPQTDKD
jgi:hypothetical protein